MCLNKSNLFSILLLLFCSTSINAQNQVIDSLNLLINQAKDNERIDLLHQAITSTWLNHPEQSILYGQRALKLSKLADDSTNISKSLRLIAGAHYYQGNYKESLEFNVKAFEIANIIKDSMLINNGLNNIGLIYYDLGNYQIALEFLIRAKVMKEKLNHHYGFSTTLNNLGMVYGSVQDYSTARTYFSEALSMAKATNNYDQIIYSQNNIGNSYLAEENYDKSRYYFNKSLLLSKSEGNVNWGAVAQRGIGQTLHHKGDYDSANYYYNTALMASTSIADKKGMAEARYLLAKLAIDLSNLDLAQQHLEKAHELAQKSKLREQLLKDFELFIAIHEKLGDHNKIINYQKDYSLLKDSLFQDLVRSNLALVPIKINEEKERLKVIDQQELINEKNKTNKLLIAVVITTIGLFFVFVYSSIRRKRDNKKLNKLLELSNEQKEELSIQSEKLNEANTEITKQKDSYKSSYETIKMLSEMGTQITASLVVAEITSKVYVDIKNLLPADMFNIGLYNEKHNTLSFSGNIEKGKINDNYTYNIDKENDRMAVKCFVSKKIIITNDLEKDFPNYPSAKVGELPLSIIITPLIQKEKVLGVLTVCALERNAYTDYHVSIIKNLAVYVSIAIENASTYHQLEKANKEISIQKESYKADYESIKILSEIGSKIISTLSIKKISAKVYENVNTLMSAPIFTLGLYNDKTQCIDFTGCIENGVLLDDFNYHVEKDTDRVAVKCFNKQEVILTNNLLEDYPTHPKAVIGELPLSCLYVPLVQKDTTIGILSVQSMDRNVYNDYHIYLLKNLAVYISIAIENANAYEKLDTSFKQILQEQAKNIRLTKNQNFLQATIDMMRDLMGKTDLHEIAWSITQTLITIYDLEDCVIYIIRDNECHQIAASGPKNPEGKLIFNPKTIKKGNGIVGTVAEFGVAEIIEDTSKDDRYVVDDKRRLSELTVPIFSNKKVIGVIDSEHSTKKFFTEEHLSTFNIIADLVSIMIENALILEEQNERELQLQLDKQDISKEKEAYKTNYESVKMLSEIGAEMISTLSISEIIDNVYKSINKHVTADSFYFGLYNKQHNYLEFKGSIKKGRKSEDFNYDLDKDSGRLASICFKSKNVLTTNDLKKDYPNYPDHLDDNSIKSVLMVPLFKGNDVIGILSIESLEKDAYTDYHMYIIKNLAVYISIAIDNAQTYEKLEDSYSQLQELDKYKEAMTAMIVHDFKNSLNTVINFSEGKPTERRLRSIRQSGQFMLTMVLNILDVQKFETTDVKLATSIDPISKPIREAIDQLDYMIEQKSIKLTYIDDPNLAGNFDFDLTSRVIVNILSNAIKYVSTNGVIEIKTLVIGKYIQVAIKDNGPGIPADKVHLVFDKFSQIDAKKSGSVRSTGIGLTFCKIVVEAQGGEIGVTSKEGEGSTFFFTLQLADENYKGEMPIKSLVLKEQKAPIFTLSDKERELLIPHITELQKWEVYDYSEVSSIIEKVNGDNLNVKTWKERVIRALQNVNEEEYNQLVNND